MRRGRQRAEASAALPSVHVQTDKYLLSAAFLQSVYHLLKLQGCDLHFLFQLIHKRVVL